VRVGVFYGYRNYENFGENSDAMPLFVSRDDDAKGKGTCSTPQTPSLYTHRILHYKH